MWGEVRPWRCYSWTQIVHFIAICRNDRFLAYPINTAHCSVHDPPMAHWQLWIPVSTQLCSIQHGVCCTHNGKGILQGVDWQGETNRQIFHDGYFWWYHEEAAVTTTVPLLRFQEQTRHLSGVPQRRGNFFPWGLLRSELFYPTLKYIVDTNSFFIELTCKAASIFRVEFRDNRKAIAK